jgi:FG-GAP-like repeat
MRRWRSAFRLVLVVVGIAWEAHAQSPIFRSLEDQFPPEAFGPLAWGDFDQDGDMDALAFWSNVFLNDGDARFTPHPVPSVVSTQWSWPEPYGRLINTVADLNGDGFPDVVTVNGSLLVAWVNQGNGVLVQAAPGFFPVLPTPPGFVTTKPALILPGDVDADGDVDLVVTLGGLGTTSSIWVPIQPQLLLNTPAGFVFATTQLPAIQTSANQGFLSDLDQDGDVDLLLADGGSFTYCSGGSAQCRAMLNNGAGVFVQSQALAGLFPRGFVVLADVNGDGYPDLASSPFWGSMPCGAVCQVALNLGSGLFGPWGSSPCQEPGVVLAANLYGNGLEEVIRLTTSGITVHNGGSAGLSPPLQGIPTPAWDGRVLDLDGDGDLDLTIQLGWRNAVLLNDGQGTLVAFTGDLWGVPAVDGQPLEVIGVAGDVDGNGSADYVWLPSAPAQPPLAVALNDGNGTLSLVAGYCAGGACPSAAGSGSSCHRKRMFGFDVNSDGRLDLYTATNFPQSSCINGPDQLHVNNGAGWSLALTLPPSIFTTNAVKQGDLNGDGLPDLVVGREYGLVPSLVLFNLGASGWSAPVQLPSHATRDVALSDLDGDGDLDLVEANWAPTSDGTAILLNDGAGNFTAAPTGAIGAFNANAVAVGDLDGDGDPDLVLDQQVWIHTTPLVFVQGPTLPITGTVNQLELVDADRDGDLDLVVGAFFLGQANVVLLFLNDGAGNFTLAESFPIGWSWRVSLADLDRDDDVDLIVPGPRILTNVTRQIAKGSILRAGRVVSLDLYGPASGSWTLYASTGSGILQIPPIGTVLLDLAGLQAFGSGTFSTAGTAMLSALLPPAPALVGFTTYLQALVGPPAHVTNLEIMTVLGL